MPSAHAQFMGFYLAFSTLQLLMRVNTNPAYKVCAIIFNLALSPRKEELSLVFPRVSAHDELGGCTLTGLWVCSPPYRLTRRQAR